MRLAGAGKAASSQEQGRAHGFFRQQLQAPVGMQRQGLDLPDHGSDFPATQGLLHGPERFGGAVARLNHEKGRRIETVSQGRRGIEIAGPADPGQRLFRREREKALPGGQERQAKAAGRRLIPFPSGGEDFLERRRRKPAAGKVIIQRGKAKGHPFGRGDFEPS